MLSETSISFSLDSYRPLPDFLTIKLSTIDGLGLFALNSIDKNTNLGVFHIKDERFVNGVIRTPLAGFVNHSDNPNTYKIENKNEGVVYLYALKDIKENDEITLKYTLYDPSI